MMDTAVLFQVGPEHQDACKLWHPCLCCAGGQEPVTQSTRGSKVNHTCQVLKKDYTSQCDIWSLGVTSSDG